MSSSSQLSQSQSQSQTQTPFSQGKVDELLKRIMECDTLELGEVLEEMHGKSTWCRQKMASLVLEEESFIKNWSVFQG